MSRYGPSIRRIKVPFEPAQFLTEGARTFIRGARTYATSAALPKSEPSSLDTDGTLLATPEGKIDERSRQAGEGFRGNANSHMTETRSAPPLEKLILEIKDQSRR